MQRSNQRAKIINQPLLLAFALAGFAFSIHAQPNSAPTSEPKVIIRVEPMAPEKEEPPAIDPALGEGRAGPTDCEQKFPMPPAKKANVPYVEDDSIICKRLVVRGQRMQCEIITYQLARLNGAYRSAVQTFMQTPESHRGLVS